MLGGFRDPLGIFFPKEERETKVYRPPFPLTWRKTLQAWVLKSHEEQDTELLVAARCFVSGAGAWS